ncbi:OmpA family protein [Flavobacterium lipolyticum]|uniref:OmpA family protein n=1 Tax=Flavobacterium lipolyticum TaxID=2893754 RepID=A0ABS8M4P5_9FLAO|nr:OmpA family protein [Flavobacterium sp. F-126]MCC9019780.1 OmpA family protein [Flavobacterium sp. F-126]
MKNFILFCLTILCFLPSNTYSQQKKVIAADKKYNSYAYIDAIKTYERLAEKGYSSEDMLKKLGNSLYFNSEFEKAAKWYGKLFAMNVEIEPEYYYRYAQSLKSTGDVVKANQMLDLFNQKAGNDRRGKLYEEDKNYIDEIKANTGIYKISDPGINSKYSDYGTAFYNNKIVFTSARDTGSLGQRKHKWTNESFTNLYESDIDQDFKAEKPKKIQSKINSKYHESTPVFTKDGKTVYFTRNNYINDKKGKDGTNTTLIKIYKATFENGDWVNITELPFDSNDYSTAHPALSPDEKTLYFASDMPGTFGQSDIFKVSINSNGGFGTPVNLGKSINTEGKETFPYITDENEIYFASDGHPGLGGLDVFSGKINENGVSDIQNIGADINSVRDDFAFIIDTKSQRGFFSSNREGGKGADDIYEFLRTKKVTCTQELYGVITDVGTGEILPNTKLTLFDSQFNVVGTTYSDESGNYTFSVECLKTYHVRAEKEKYLTKELSVTVSNETGKTNLPITLEKLGCTVTIGDDLAKCFGIKMIYFALDKSDIRAEAVLDLEKILDVLKQYPEMKLDIRSHTDSRQTHKYNEGLSDRRAKSTIKWLVQNGINPSRLEGKGYGETQLINGCSDGVKCTEEEHQANRRSEFIVVAL